MLASFRTAHINKNVLIIIDADSTVSEEVSGENRHRHNIRNVILSKYLHQ